MQCESGKIRKRIKPFDKFELTQILHPLTDAAKTTKKPLKAMRETGSGVPQKAGPRMNRFTIAGKRSRMSGVESHLDFPGGKMTPALRSLVLVFLLTLPLMAANQQSRPSTSVPTTHNEWTVAELQRDMASGKLT